MIRWYYTKGQKESVLSYQTDIVYWIDVYRSDSEMAFLEHYNKIYSLSDKLWWLEYGNLDGYSE